MSCRVDIVIFILPYRTTRIRLVREGEFRKHIFVIIFGVHVGQIGHDYIFETSKIHVDIYTSIEQCQFDYDEIVKTNVLFIFENRNIQSNKV